MRQSSPPAKQPSHHTAVSVVYVPGILRLLLCNQLGVVCHPGQRSGVQRMRLMLRVCLQLLKFVGCYHGHADSYLVQAGSGVATLGLPDSPGVPAASTGAFAMPD